MTCVNKHHHIVVLRAKSLKHLVHCSLAIVGSCYYLFVECHSQDLCNAAELAAYAAEVSLACGADIADIGVGNHHEMHCRTACSWRHLTCIGVLLRYCLYALQHHLILWLVLAVELTNEIWVHLRHRYFSKLVGLVPGVGIIGIVDNKGHVADVRLIILFPHPKQRREAFIVGHKHHHSHIICILFLLNMACVIGGITGILLQHLFVNEPHRDVFVVRIDEKSHEMVIVWSMELQSIKRLRPTNNGCKKGK